MCPTWRGRGPQPPTEKAEACGGGAEQEQKLRGLEIRKLREFSKQAPLVSEPLTRASLDELRAADGHAQSDEATLGRRFVATPHLRPQLGNAGGRGRTDHPGRPQGGRQNAGLAKQQLGRAVPRHRAPPPGGSGGKRLGCPTTGKQTAWRRSHAQTATVPAQPPRAEESGARHTVVRAATVKRDDGRFRVKFHSNPQHGGRAVSASARLQRKGRVASSKRAAYLRAKIERPGAETHRQ